MAKINFKAMKIWEIVLSVSMPISSVHSVDQSIVTEINNNKMLFQTGKKKKEFENKAPGITTYHRLYLVGWCLPNLSYI
jgi:hypothetical protein